MPPERQLGVADPAPGRGLLVARVHRDRGLQRRTRLHQRLRVIALPQRQRRQGAQRADLERPLAVGAHQAQAFFQLATSPRQLAEPEPAGADVAVRDGLVAPVTGRPMRGERLLVEQKRADVVALHREHHAERIQAQAFDPAQRQRARLGQGLLAR